MTIKELCIKCGKCSQCSFYNACELLDCKYEKFLDDVEDDLVTKSIIETAKLLVSEGETNYNG